MNISSLLEAPSPPPSPVPHPPSTPQQSRRSSVSPGPLDSPTNIPTIDPFDSAYQHEESTPISQAHSRKRRFDEDPSQFAELAARNLRLKPSAERQLKDFSLLNSSQQLTWIGAHLLSFEDTMKDLTHAESQYQMPTSLLNRIERYTFTTLMSPTLSAYVEKDGNGPVRPIMDHLAKNPSWGLTPEVKADKAKLDVVVSRVRTRLTNRRNQIKNLLKGSLGTSSIPPSKAREGATDIVALCEAIVGLGGNICKIPVSVQMAARVAFLRGVFVENLGQESDGDVKKFWQKADSSLSDIRSKKQSPERISRLFTVILHNDRDIYGKVSMDSIVEIVDPDVFSSDEA